MVTIVFVQIPGTLACNDGFQLQILNLNCCTKKTDNFINTSMFGSTPTFRSHRKSEFFFFFKLFFTQIILITDFLNFYLLFWLFCFLKNWLYFVNYQVKRQHDDAIKEINQAMTVRIKASKDIKRLTEERNAAMQVSYPF